MTRDRKDGQMETGREAAESQNTAIGSPVVNSGLASTPQIDVNPYTDITGETRSFAVPRVAPSIWFKSSDGVHMVMREVEGVPSWLDADGLGSHFIPADEGEVLCLITDVDGIPFEDYGFPVVGEYFADDSFTTVVGSIREVK